MDMHILFLAWVARDRDVIYNFSYPIPNLTCKPCSMFLQTRLWGPSHGFVGHLGLVST